MTRLPHRLSHRERLLAVLDADLIFVLGEALPRSAAFLGGRPRTYPAWLPFLYAAAIDVFGSALAVQVQFADPRLWDEVRDAVVHRHPDDPELWLPERPPTRDLYRKSRDRLLRYDDALDAVLDAYRVEAAHSARTLGLVDPTRRVQWGAIDRRDVLVGWGVTGRRGRPRQRPGWLRELLTS